MKLLRGVISFLKDTFYYLIAVPILFLVNKFVLGYKLIGKENIKKVPGAKITISSCTYNRLFYEWISKFSTILLFCYTSK